MRPGDHPEFFRFPAPEGRSRESSIVLDAQGRFHHDGELVEHPGMARAFASWIDRHPDDGRFILNNGYDWSYFRVEDVPFFVLGVREQAGQARALALGRQREPARPGQPGRWAPKAPCTPRSKTANFGRASRRRRKSLSARGWRRPKTAKFSWKSPVPVTRSKIPVRARDRRPRR